MSGNVPSPTERDPLRLNRAIRDLFEGRGNNTGQFTMGISVGSTTVTHPNIGIESTIDIIPRHANAATEFGAGTWYISAVAAGSFTVVHVNSATANRTFDYVIHG